MGQKLFDDSKQRLIYGFELVSTDELCKALNSTTSTLHTVLKRKPNFLNYKRFFCIIIV